MSRSNCCRGNGLIVALRWLTWDPGQVRGGGGFDGVGNSSISNRGVETSKWKQDP